jgi:hypothetical protein
MLKELTFLWLLIPTLCDAQLVKGRVFDQETKLPVSYVNIGVVNKNVGTVSMEDGSFQLNLTNRNEDDTLRFSSIGYDDKSFLVSNVRKLSIDKMEVMLTHKTILLNEVIVKGKSRSVTILGHRPKTRFTKAGLTSNQLGHEIGTLFNNPDSSVHYLDSVQLNFVECKYDSIFVRLNVYAVTGERTINILPENVLLAMNKKRVLSRPVIDLSRFNLLIENHFLISIEIVKDLGPLGLKFYGVTKAREHTAQYRQTSQGHWQTTTFKGEPFGISILSFVH